MKRARPRPFLSAGRSSIGRLVLTCEHASRRLPVEVPRDPQIRTVLASHWGWDIGAWGLTRALSSRLRVPAVGGHWSRLWVDLNREADDATLMRREAGSVTVPWNAGLTAVGAERRWMEAHIPYHAEVDRLIFSHRVRKIEPMLVAIHTFTDDYQGEARDFDAGVLFRDHRSLAWRIGRALREAGLRVRYNQPYSGIEGLMYAIQRHGSHHCLPCIELEFNQRLFDDRGRLPALARATARALRRGLQEL